MTLLPSQTPSAVPFLNIKYMSIYSLPVTNNATTPNTKVDVGSGICRDSTDIYDMILSSAVTIDTGVVGLNGIDTGVLQASKLYYVLLVSDPVNGLPTGAMVSLSSSAPIMPSGYGVFRVIGYMMTDASTHFLACYNSGDQNARVFKFDAPQATAVTAGNATSYTAVSLANLVPPIENLEVSIAYSFTPGAASRVLNLTPGNATGNAVTVTGQVTSVVVSGNADLFARVTAGVPEVDYKVSNSGDAVALNVAGFRYYL